VTECAERGDCRHDRTGPLGGPKRSTGGQGELPSVCGMSHRRGKKQLRLCVSGGPVRGVFTFDLGEF